MKKICLIFAGILLFSGILCAKKIIPLDIEKGGMFDDNTEQVEAALSEDNLGTNATTSEKVVYPAEGGWAGLWMPKKAAWEGIKTLTCFIYNANSKNVKLSFVIKDRSHVGGNSGRGKEGWEARKTWSIVPLDLKPGMNEVKVDINAMKTQEGKALDLSMVKHWGFYYRFFPELEWEEKAAEPFTMYLSKIKLED